jgi:oligogalacturonide transporter
MKPRLTTGTKLLYGSGEFFNGTTTAIILFFYLKFLTDIVLIPPFWAGICIIAGQFWDAVNDPLIGSISDRTKSRFGRRRIYFLLFTLPASVSFFLMWITVGVDALWAKIVYYAAIYVVFKTVASLLNVPYQAMGPELASDYNERTSLITYRMAFSLFGAIVAGVVPNIIIGIYARSNTPNRGHLWIGGICGVIYLGVWLSIFLFIREPEDERGSSLSVPFFKGVATVLKNKSYRIVLGMYLFSFMTMDMLTAGTKYYVDDFFRNTNLMSVMLGTMLTCGMLSLPVYRIMIRKTDRRTAYMIGTLVWMGVHLLLLAFPRDGFPPLLIGAMVFVGFGVGSAFMIPWSALPEVVDLEQAVLHTKQEGVYSGLMTFLRKVTTSFSVFIIAILLDLTGYIPPTGGVAAEQPIGVLWVIRLFMTGIPAFFLLLAFLVGRQYPLTKQFYALLRRFLHPTEEDESLSAREKVELKSGLEEAYGQVPDDVL